MFVEVDNGAFYAGMVPWRRLRIGPGDLAAVLALRRLADDADPAPPPPSACVI
jgi:hypothetical protein